MVKLIKNNRYKNAEKKKFTPKPCWVEAFMILLLHKNAVLKQKVSGKPEIAQIEVSLADLKRFEVLEGDNKTKLTFDKVKGTVTITAPEAVMPKIQYNKRLIT